MMTHQLTEKEIAQFEQYLIDTEKSRGTIAKYLRDIAKFRLFLSSEKAVDKETAMEFKEYLLKLYNVNTANSVLAALNSLFVFLDWSDCRVKSFKQSKRIFRAEEREMSRSDYLKMLNTAKSEGKERLYYRLC